jgi:hypothetical protein
MSNIDDNIVGVNTVTCEIMDKIKSISEPEINGNLVQQLNILEELTEINNMVSKYQRIINCNLKGVIIENGWLDAFTIDKHKIKEFMNDV